MTRGNTPRVVEIEAQLQKLRQEYWKLVEPTEEEVKGYAEMVLDDRRSAAEQLAEDVEGQVGYALDTRIECSVCGKEVDGEWECRWCHKLVCNECLSLPCAQQMDKEAGGHDG